jgi:hypothetical protein
METARGTVVRYLLIIAAIALAPFLLSHLNPHPAAVPTPSVTPTQDPAQSPLPQVYELPKLGQDVPPVSARRIRTVVLGVAMLGGDAKPTSIMVVTATLPQALRDSPSVHAGRGSPLVVYLAVMKGSFAYSTVNTLGVDVSSGHYISVVFAPVTLTPLGSTLSGQAPAIPLSRLGPVIDLLHIP